MEFLSGYAAAKAPYLAYEVEDRFQHSRRSKPARSNSTSRATTTKRSRIPGHARTNSASTNSSGSGSGRTEHEPPTPHHNAGWLQSPAGGAGVDVSGSSAVTSTAAHRAEPIAAQHHGRHRLRRNSARELERESERERMSAPLKHYQDKQLPATPRLNTQEASAKLASAANAAEPASARTPASAGATFGNSGAVVAAVAFPDRRMPPQPVAAMYPYPSDSKMSGSGGAKAESVSSVSGATSTSNRMSEQRSDSAHHQWPFVVRNGRTYLADPDLPYPLPVDLEELNRQVLKTMMMLQLFGRPICSPEFTDNPPSRILDAGCGTGFWSMMCHRYYAARGHKDISFTGLDIVQLPPTLATGSTGSSSSISGDAPPPDRPDKDMNWRFVQHDLRKVPLPFPDESFDYIMSKDMCLAVSATMNQGLIEEYIRVLKPGGTLELWETDHMLRMLRPHVPDDGGTTSGPSIFTTELDSSSFSSSSSSTINTADDQQQQQQQQQQQYQSKIGGAYIMTANTPLSTPLNTFLVEYNSWITRALETRALNPTPCTAIGALLVQEAETLTNPGSRRLAVPLSEIRWEREGVGGVVTKDGKSYIESASKGTARRAAAAAAAAEKEGGSSSSSTSGGGGTTGAEGTGGGGGGGGCPGSGAAGAATVVGSTGRRLDPAAAALRKTALMTVVHRIQSLEPLLREVSGKSQDEWDTWLGKMINNLVRENGTSLGECLEVGAWWAKKRIPKP